MAAVSPLLFADCASLSFVRCLGSVQHLKSKFDSGYMLSVLLQTDSTGDTAAAFMRRFLARFPSAKLIDRDGETKLVLGIARQAHKHTSELQFETGRPCLHRDSVSLADLFEQLESWRGSTELVAFSLCQAATLERVFVALASQSDGGL